MSYLAQFDLWSSDPTAHAALEWRQLSEDLSDCAETEGMTLEYQRKYRTAAHEAWLIAGRIENGDE